jgi:hypothetical protein
MKPLRVVTEADIRLSSSGNIIAAPVWAYELTRYSRGRFWQIEEVWAPFYERRKVELEQKKQQQEEQFEKCVQVLADPAATENAKQRARMVVSMHKVSGRNRSDRAAASLYCPSFDALKRCRVCDVEFFGLGSTATCTPACEAARKKATRTRGEPKIRRVFHELRQRDHCFKEFLPRRKDTRFCSVRCRVADHRFRHPAT